MAILRTIHDSHFTTVANDTVRDPSISFKAKGILFLLLSCSDNWSFTEAWIATRSTDGLTAIKSALHELENAHYLKRYRLRNEDGTLGEGVYEVYERPYDSDEPICSSPMSENRTLDNEPLRNNNIPISDGTEEKQSKNTHGAFEEVIAYLNTKAGKNFKASSKHTAALISARFKEGFSIEDFKRVIDNKVADWKLRPEMERYLRPETLFGSKFEGYLNEAPAKKESKSQSSLGYSMKPVRLEDFD